MLGSWTINVSVGSMPEKIATAVGELDNMIGAEYTPIAYLGSQLVHGTNHAVLAEQTIVCGKDVKNVVLLIFHETKEGVTLSNIERVVEGGNGMGSTNIKVETGDAINVDAQKIFDSAFDGFVGQRVVPFALLGTQVVRGIDYIFACECTPVIPDAEKKVCIVTVNDLDNHISFVDLMKSNVETNALASVKGALKLQSPWVLFYKEVFAFFAKDPQIKVLFNDEEPELKIQVKGNDEKAACLARFFPTQKAFGNVILNCSVVGDDGQPVPDVNLDNKTAIMKMFEGNDAVSFIKDVPTPFQYSILYIVFAKEVVQYYSDDMYDLYGCTSTLYEDIARDIFQNAMDISSDFCSFCTDAEVSLGTPLGEWP